MVTAAALTCTTPSPAAHLLTSPHTQRMRLLQLVSDLRTIRTLMEFLLQFDAVTYLTYLENLRATESVGAIWLFRDATHTVFEQVCACRCCAAALP